jgi:hypothetical protein
MGMSVLFSPPLSCSLTGLFVFGRLTRHAHPVTVVVRVAPVLVMVRELVLPHIDKLAMVAMAETTWLIRAGIALDIRHRETTG